MNLALPVFLYGDTILNEKCHPVPTSQEVEEFVTVMKFTMNQTDGIGLAAPQVGKPWNLFIVDTLIAYNEMPDKERIKKFGTDRGISQVFINARITEYSPECTTEEEGCLSIPDVWMDIERAQSITIEYEDENRRLHTQSFSGYTARVIQHEYDHTQGILITDRLKPELLKYYSKQLNKIAGTTRTSS